MNKHNDHNDVVTSWQKAGWQSTQEIVFWHGTGWHDPTLALLWKNAGWDDPLFALKVYSFVSLPAHELFKLIKPLKTFLKHPTVQSVMSKMQPHMDEKQWKKVGWTDKTEIKKWITAGWTDPVAAFIWHNSGWQDPKFALRWLHAFGVNNALIAFQWFSLGWDKLPEEAYLWFKSGWQDKIIQAKQWFDAGWIDPRLALKWANLNVSPAEAMSLHQRGIHPDGYHYVTSRKPSDNFK